MKNRIAVIGAGVSGLTCAVCLAEGGSRTTIFAEEIGQSTTSAAAGAIWFPYEVQPVKAAVAWSLRTYRVLRELSEFGDSGVSMIELRCFSRAGQIEIPPWATTLGAKCLVPSAIPHCFTSGFNLDVPLTDTTRYLDYLSERFRASGGEIEGNVHFDRIEDVSREFDLIINCAGIGAKTLVPDPGLEPHRGQVLLVPKIESAHAIVCDDPPLMYAIPRGNDCVFGGTNEISGDRESDPTVSRRILADCSRALGIGAPKILAERVGLRPFRRAGVCLRADRLRDGRVVIHNYGHGGAGFTLSWGCAQEILALTGMHLSASKDSD